MFDSKRKTFGTPSFLPSLAGFLTDKILLLTNQINEFSRANDSIASYINNRTRSCQIINMSILVLQIIIKQWDKSQRTEACVEQRAGIPGQYLIDFPPAFYAFNKQCVIDQHGDDVLGNRVTYSQGDDGKINFDRFQISLNSKVLEYTGKSGSKKGLRTIGSLDNKWMQCKYDWRYSVYEGGFYYWLYEAVTLNVISISKLNESVFLDSDPTIVFTG
jgi:hypothetical protein